MKYLIKCCGRIVDVDNKPIWCIKCSGHDIEVVSTQKIRCSLSFVVANRGRGNGNYEDFWYECEDCGANIDSAID